MEGNLRAYQKGIEFAGIAKQATQPFTMEQSMQEIDKVKFYRELINELNDNGEHLRARQVWSKELRAINDVYKSRFKMILDERKEQGE